MLNIADFSFAVELFVIYFCFFCWLFHSPSANKTSQKMKEETEQESLLVSDGNDTALPQPTLKTDSIDNADAKNEKQKGDTLTKYIQDLSMPKLRKITSLLKKADIIAKDEKTGGKGIGKVQLVGLIQQKLMTDKEAVITILKDFNSEIATFIKNISLFVGGYELLLLFDGLRSQ